MLMNYYMRTAANPLPAISALSDSASGTDITVTFTTDIAAYNIIEWGTVSGTYTQYVDNLVSTATSHDILLGALDGLVAGTTYYGHVGASVNGSNWTYSAEFTFTTDAAYQFYDGFTPASGHLADPPFAQMAGFTGFLDYASGFAVHGGGGDKAYYIDTLTPGADWDVEVPLYKISAGTSGNAGLIICGDAAGQEFYYAAFNSGAGGYWRIFKYAAGALNDQSPTSASGQPVNGEAAVVLRVAKVGNDFTLYADNTSLITWTSASAYSGAPGLGMMFATTEFAFGPMTVNP